MKTALIIIGAILLVIVIPHLVVSFIVFRINYGRKSDKKIKMTFDTNPDYNPCRKELNESFKELETKNRQEIEIKSYDGFALRGYYYNNNSKKIVVFFHGFHTDPQYLFSYVALKLYEQGYNVLYVYLRAHGISEGVYSTYGFHEQEDVLSWVKYLISQGEENIYLYGASMGATSISLASPRLDKKYVKAIVLDSPYTTVQDLIGHLSKVHHVPTFLFMGLIKFYARVFAKIDFNKLDAREALKHNEIPALFVHGTKDNVVIDRQFDDNYDNCASIKKKLLIEGAGHAIGFTYGGEQSIQQLMAFLNANGGLSNG